MKMTYSNDIVINTLFHSRSQINIKYKNWVTICFVGTHVNNENKTKRSSFKKFVHTEHLTEV